MGAYTTLSSFSGKSESTCVFKRRSMNGPTSACNLCAMSSSPPTIGSSKRSRKRA